MRRLEDMTTELFDQLLKYLEDDNGVEPPSPATAKRRWESTATLFKVMYKRTEPLEDIDAKLSILLERLESSPPVIYWVRTHLLQTGGAIIGFSLFMLILWLVLYIIVQDAAVASWLHSWLGIPELLP